MRKNICKPNLLNFIFIMFIFFSVNLIISTKVSAKVLDKIDTAKSKSVKITCISETGWFDNSLLLKNAKSQKGMKESQYLKQWDQENAAGSSSLVEIESLDGTKHKFLVDTGWNVSYMDEIFKSLKIDKMLKNGEIEFLLITHEHLDHLWGIEAVLKYNPNIKIYVPGTISEDGLELLKGKTFSGSSASNKIPHKGELVMLNPGKAHRILPEVVAVTFDIPIILGIRGETSLYFSLKNKGIVSITGCCHQGVIELLDFAKTNMVDGDHLYGIYGGLHIAPFGPINQERQHLIEAIGNYRLKKIAANHCTGIEAVQKMIDLGYPIIKGTGKDGSISNLYIGNGDQVIFHSDYGDETEEL